MTNQTVRYLGGPRDGQPVDHAIVLDHGFNDWVAHSKDPVGADGVLRSHTYRRQQIPGTTAATYVYLGLLTDDEIALHPLIGNQYERSAAGALDHVDRTFSYQPPMPHQVPRYEYLRSLARNLGETIVRLTPSSHEQLIALDRLSETIMWANAAIARNETP